MLSLFERYDPPSLSSRPVASRVMSTPSGRFLVDVHDEKLSAERSRELTEYSLDEVDGVTLYENAEETACSFLIAAGNRARAASPDHRRAEAREFWRIVRGMRKAGHFRGDDLRRAIAAGKKEWRASPVSRKVAPILSRAEAIAAAIHAATPGGHGFHDMSESASASGLLARTVEPGGAAGRWAEPFFVLIDTGDTSGDAEKAEIEAKRAFDLIPKTPTAKTRPARVRAYEAARKHADEAAAAPNIRFDRVADLVASIEDRAYEGAWFRVEVRIIADPDDGTGETVDRDAPAWAESSDILPGREAAWDAGCILAGGEVLTAEQVEARLARLPKPVAPSLRPAVVPSEEAPSLQPSAVPSEEAPSLANDSAAPDEAPSLRPPGRYCAVRLYTPKGSIDRQVRVTASGRWDLRSMKALFREGLRHVDAEERTRLESKCPKTSEDYALLMGTSSTPPEEAPSLSGGAVPSPPRDDENQSAHDERRPFRETPPETSCATNPSALKPLPEKAARTFPAPGGATTQQPREKSSRGAAGKHPSCSARTGFLTRRDTSPSRYRISGGRARRSASGDRTMHCATRPASLLAACSQHAPPKTRGRSDAHAAGKGSAETCSSRSANPSRAFPQWENQATRASVVLRLSGVLAKDSKSLGGSSLPGEAPSLRIICGRRRPSCVDVRRRSAVIRRPPLRPRAATPSAECR